MMHLSLNDSETRLVRKALDAYLSRLRSEIVNTDNREWKKNLHAEEDELKAIIEKFMTASAA